MATSPQFKIRRDIPDGEYLTEFIAEDGIQDKYIFAVLRITHGPFKNQEICVYYDSQQAREITREYTGLYISRLAAEEEQRAIDLDHARDQAYENQFLVNFKMGLVEEVIDPNDSWERIAEMLGISI